MSRPLRVGISGAGRVFERLYAPALARVSEIQVVAVADPVGERCATGPATSARFDSLASLLEGATVDAAIVLSPPAHHADDASLALAHGLPVLVEKPLCASREEVVRLRAADADALLTPAFSRRYWPAYRRIAARGPVRELHLAIAVHPASWGAYAGPSDVADDLFPHVADLARWLTGSEIATVTARRGAHGVAATLEMDRGGRVTARLDTRAAYREAARADGRGVHVGPPTSATSLLRRAKRRDDPAVEAVKEMLSAWAERVGGRAPAGLPCFEDGAASVAATQQLRAALAPGSPV
jgi:predicted dehydrogenase